MQIFSSKNDCCGCSACKSICPKNAIEMVADSEGFLYPVIDNDKCIDCGLCKKVCAFQSDYNKNTVRTAYAVKHKDFDTRMTSRSGGVFVAISDYVLKKGGSVYGAGYDKNLVVCQQRTLTAEERNGLKGTKYVQSDVRDTYTQVKNDLENGLDVLYSGTPCQLAGLTSYLSKTKCDTTKLITVDLICHGTPSPLIFSNYIDYCEKKYGGKAEKFNFRDKSFGWRSQKEAVWINGEKHNSNEYAYLFSSHEVFRPSCFNCKYANSDRPSDFTLGDFWGIDELVKGFSDNKGVSLLLVNSEKGKNVFDICKADTDYAESDYEKIVPFNPNLYRPTKLPRNREKFWKAYHNKGFDYIRKKTYNKILRLRVFQKIRQNYRNIKKKIFK